MDEMTYPPLNNGMADGGDKKSRLGCGERLRVEVGIDCGSGFGAFYPERRRKDPLSAFTDSRRLSEPTR
jgi:hypothetical protein